MAEFRKAGLAVDLAEGQIVAKDIHGERIAFYNLGGEFFATTDYCSHTGCSLEDFGKIHGSEVECICHGARFKIRTGEVTRLPAVNPLKVYRVKVQDGELWVEV